VFLRRPKAVSKPVLSEVEGGTANGKVNSTRALRDVRPDGLTPQERGIWLLLSIKWSKEKTRMGCKSPVLNERKIFRKPAPYGAHTKVWVTLFLQISSFILHTLYFLYPSFLSPCLTSMLRLIFSPMIMKKLFLCVVITVCLIAACESRRVESVVLITVDGMSVGDAAAIDFIQNRGVVFENALTPSPATLPAITSVMTGMHPVGHGVEADGYWSLEGTAVTMAEVFQFNDHRTAAFVGAGDLGPETGLEQGFDIYRYDFDGVPAGPFGYPLYEPAPSLTKKTVKWLGFFGDKPFFLWVHYGDLADGWVKPLSDEQKKKRLDEIASSIEKLSSALSAKGKKTIIVLTAPAANAVSRGERGHGTLLYNSTIRTPLYVIGPGIPRSKSAAPVSLEDILPTVAEFLDFSIPQGMQGRNLAPVLRGGKGPGADRGRLIVTKEPFYKWGLSPLKSLVKGKYKLIQGPGEHAELYDIQNDSGEEKNIAADKTKLTEDLKRELAALESALSRGKKHALELLPIPRAEGALSSPVEKIKAIELLGKAARLFREKDYAGALKVLQEAQTVDPKNKSVAFAMAIVAQPTLPKEEVVQMWLNAAKLNPNDSMVLASLAQLHYEAGDIKAALIALKKALEVDSNNPIARMLSGDILFVQAKALKGEKRVEMLNKALKNIIAVLHVDDSNVLAYYKFGLAAMALAGATDALPMPEKKEDQSKHLARIKSLKTAARNAFEGAIEIDSAFPAAYFALGRWYLSEGNRKQAQKNLETYLKLDPEGPGAKEARKRLKSLPRSQP